jgi:molybdenum cofactor cytidylyltransferase
MSNGEQQVIHVGAVVLAAGQSRRMGKPKLALPWGSRTVIEQVVLTLLNAGISEIVVVTGGAGEAIEMLLQDYPIRLVHNPEYAHSEMATTLQIGIRSLTPACQAALVVLGDQPTIEEKVVKKIVETYLETGAAIIIPSFQMHRGHPWLVGRSLWPDLLALVKEQTLREFTQEHVNDIAYIQTDTPAILYDLDTPEDYLRLRPRM